MAADIEQKALVIHRPADAADVDRILLDHVNVAAGLGERVGGGESGRSGSDHKNIKGLHQTFSTGHGSAENIR